MKDSNTLAQKLLSKDTNDFWKEINKTVQRDQYSSIAEKIDDATISVSKNVYLSSEFK